MHTDRLPLAYHILPYHKCNSPSLPALYIGKLYMAKTTVRKINVKFLWVTRVWGKCYEDLKKKKYLLSVFYAILNGCLVPAHHTLLLSNALDNS